MAGAGPHPELRELLFADLPAARAREVFARGGAATAPVVELAAAAESRDVEAAKVALAKVQAADREARVRLQAWSLAREAGIDPGEAAADVLGVVVDMGLDEGLDTLAAFADGSARYLNHSGSAIVWEVPDERIGSAVRSLLDAASAVAAVTGPLEGQRPRPPAPGGAMISILTPGGIHVGAASIELLSRDARGGPVIAAAGTLLGLLVDRAMQARQGQPSG